MQADQVKSNRRLGLILGTVAVAFFLGFIARIFLISGQSA